METLIRNILAPTNFSTTGNNALNAAANLCKKNNAVLHLVHVVENKYPVSVAQPAGSIASIATENDYEAREQLYNIYEAILRDYNIPVQIYMPTGMAAHEICKIAEDINIDLVVMGTAGASGIKDFFMGSTAQRIIQNITRPLLTIPGNFEAGSFNNILFPVRAIAEVKEKYNFIQSLLNKKSSVHIAALCIEGDEEKLLHHKQDFHEIINSLKRLRILCTKDMYTCKNLAHKVIDISRTITADLIVINYAARYRWTQCFTGTYTQQVINHSHVPVLSYRSRKNL